MKTHCIYILVLLLTLSTKGFTQHPQRKELTRYLQSRLDSSITYSTYSSWTLRPVYLIIGKNKNELHYYTYQQPGAEPHLISDTCVHFRRLDPTTKKDYWSELLHTGLWTTAPYIRKELKTVTDSSSTIHHIFDADEHDFYFITPNGIQQQYFYAPGFYNLHRPDKTLQKALKAISIFNTAFSP